MLRRFVSPLVVLLFVVAGCQKVPLLGPTGSTISISAHSSSLAPGASTQVTATVIESGGTPVHDGTLVRFSATLGRVEPAEVETRGGSATTTFIAGTTSGTAQIRATSGAASGGEGEAAANAVSITIGGANATTVVVSASPARLGPSGGTTTITASVLDTAGNRLSGVPVTFSTDQGSLSSSAAVTDGNGDARVSLTTNRAAKVTARTGGGTAGTSGEVTITLAPSAALTLALSANTVQAGSPVTLTVTAPTDTAPRVIVNWGDGTTTDLGTVTAGTGRPVTHIYQSAGSYTITATANSDGESVSASTAITVTARSPLNVGLTASSPNPAQCVPVTFTADVTAAGETNLAVSSYRWTIQSSVSSENEERTTTSRTFTRAFQNPGRKNVSVRVTTVDGREGNAETQIVVPTTPVTTPPTPPPVCP